MNERNISLNSLPVEIIEQILNVDDITHKDICRLSSVSDIFNCIGKSNKLWRNKYKKMWPRLWPLYDTHNTNWKEVFKLRLQFKKEVSIMLQGMSETFYQQDNVSNDSFCNFRLEFFDPPFGHGIFVDHILVDELESIIHDSNCHLNLTHKYYAKRALRYMRHLLLEAVWREYLFLKQDKLTLLKGACLISQWCQPTKMFRMEYIYTDMNDTICLVFEQIKRVCPNHPVIKLGLPVLRTDDEVILERSVWSPAECKVILHAINEIMFNVLYFRGTDYFYSASNSYIEKVLSYRKGIPISLGIIYEAIASKFGVACLPVNFPGHFLLKWLEHPLSTGPDAYTFIDVFDKGIFKTWKELEDLAPGYDSFSNSWIDAVSPVKVFTRMCWNLVEIGRDSEGEGLLCLCNALELLSLLSPDDMEHKLLLARVYMHLCINMTRVISLLQEISEQDPMSAGIVGYMYRAAETNINQRKNCHTELKVQSRIPDCDVQYAVGMIMKHRKYNYRCVIYGWDATCVASEDWIKQMGVYSLSHKDKQPFYLVLVEDGTNRYAAQENLEIDCENKPVMHFEVGRYFESYHGNYYYPNCKKLEEYPDDIAAREKALSAVQLV